MSDFKSQMRCRPSYLVALLALLSAAAPRASAEQPTIHAFLVFCDAYPGDAGNINESVASDRTLVRPLFENYVSEKSWQVRLNMVEISGAEATKAGIERKFAELAKTIGPDDTLYVHFSGHGEISDQAEGVQFLYATDLELINRQKWAEQIAALPCRLKILITDCCSSYPPETQVAEGTDPVDPWNTMYYLLRRHTGFVNITAASPGQAAYGTMVGGFLTVNLESDMQRFRTWKEVFESTRDRVFTESSEEININADPNAQPQRPLAYSLGRPIDEEQNAEPIPESLSYQIADSAQRDLSEDELEDMSMQQLYLARNEVFARHGYDFSSEMLAEYFAGRDWYQRAPGFKDPELSATEIRNVELILRVEKSIGGPFITTTALPDSEGNTSASNEPPDIFPHSSDEVLPRTVVQNLPLQELSIARNEIYARHGYPFSASALQDYFALKSYYRRDPSATDPAFNTTEEHNLWLIRKIERIKGGPHNW